MKKLIILLCAHLGLTLHTFSQSDYSISSTSLTNGYVSSIFTWDITERSLLGIRARDPINEMLQNTSYGAFKLLSRKKQNCAGVLNRYGTEPENHGEDWNLMMKLLDDFHFLYDVGLVNYNSEKWYRCIENGKPCDRQYYTNEPCMFAEIAPDNNFYRNNRWFRPNTADHCQEGEFLKRTDTICVYGPFVKDNNHGNNPEIHPAQQIWFRNKQKTTSQKAAYWMMFIQDASDRFGNWSKSPIYGQFLIAFKIKPPLIPTGPLTINIDIAAKKDLVTKLFPLHSKDCDDGSSHSLVVDGLKLITINEKNDDDDLGIQFTDLCKLSTGEIQGYIQISMVLGDYDTDEIGICVLDTEVFRDQIVVLDPPILKN